MNQDNTEKLLALAPILYGRDLPPREDFWGFEVGDGWFKPLESLSVLIECYNTHHPAAPVRAIQIKEKFGGLRFYTDVTIPEVEKMIDEAEVICVMTCSQCGEPAKLRNSPWNRTECDKCDEARKSKRSLFGI